MVQLREAEDAEPVGARDDGPESAGVLPAHLSGCAKHTIASAMTSSGVAQATKA